MGGAALPIVGGALGLYSAGSAARNQKRAVRAQEGIARNQTQLFRQTSPFYNAALSYLAQNAGLQIPGTATPANGSPGSTPLPAGTGGLPGIFGQNEQDRLAFQAAEEDLSRTRDRSAEQLKFQLGQRGAGEATISSALARNEGDYMQQLSAFRRQLALAARAEQERRVASLLGALNPGLGQGAAASGAFGGLANMFGGQGAAAAGGLNSFLQNWYLAEAMKKYRGGTGGIAGGDPLNSYDPSGGITGQWWGSGGF
jgi:hypothetical protein